MELWILGGIPETSDLDLGEKVGNLVIFGGYSLETLDLDLGEKVGNLVIFGGYSGNFGFGLRTKSWNFGLRRSIPGTSDLEIRSKSWNFGFWGVLPETSDLDLGEKVGNLVIFWGGGFFGNFGFGLRRKSWKFGHFWGGGVLWKLRIWT